MKTSGSSNLLAIISGSLAGPVVIFLVVSVLYILVMNNMIDGKRNEDRSNGSNHNDKRNDYSTAIYNTGSQQLNVTSNNLDTYESVTDDDRRFETLEVQKSDVDYSSHIYFGSNSYKQY